MTGLLVGTDDGLFQLGGEERRVQQGVYRRPLTGDTPFERCTVGLPEWFDDNIDTFCLHGRGGDAAFGTRDGRVFVSGNTGASWGQVTEGLPAIRSLVLTSE